jgi:hypothetical protein
MSSPTINQGKKTSIRVTLTDSQGNPLAYKSVKLIINKKTYIKNTNAYGVAIFNIGGLKGGKYKATGIYNGDNTYASFMTSKYQIVNPKVDLAILKVKKIKNRYNKQVSKYIVTIQNKGSLKSKKTQLKLWHVRKGIKIHSKSINIKPIKGNKKINIIVTYYPDKAHHKYCKKQYFVLNPKKTMNEITYKNNKKVIKV